MCPIRSPGPIIAKRTPERIGQSARISRKNSAKKMRLISRGRIGLRPAADPSIFPLSKKSRAAGEDHGLIAPPMHFPQICGSEAQNAYSPRNGLPAGGSTGDALLTLVYASGSASLSPNCVFVATYARHIKG